MPACAQAGAKVAIGGKNVFPVDKMIAHAVYGQLKAIFIGKEV